MKRIKHLSILILIASILLLVPIVSNAADVTINRTVQSTGTFTFNISGLNLDTSKTYKWGITAAQAGTIDTWYDLTNLTATTATIVLQPTNSQVRSVINAGDKGYISIKDSSDAISLDHKEVNLQMPYLLVTNYTKINNGEIIDTRNQNINVPLRNAKVCKAYYQYQKITDQNIIDKYNKIKSANGDNLDLSDSLPTTHPISNWKEWDYFNNYDDTGLNGYGYTINKISVPDKGLYLLWVYFSGTSGYKDIYGYILVDNLDGTSNTPNNNDNSGTTGESSNNKGQTTGSTTTKGTDTTLKSGSLPYAGVGIGIITLVVLVVIGGIYTYIKYFRLKDI